MRPTAAVTFIALTLAACHKKPPEPELVVAPTPTPVEEAPAKPQPATPQPDLELTSVYFDFDRSEVRADQVPGLDADLRALQADPRVTIEIQGHCDERGTTEYNLALGERRAHAVKQWLVLRGVGESRIRTVTYGEERPADAGHDEAAWARNRRADLIVVETPKVAEAP
jgi:peptidoglycan-associated lipoprotein